MPAYPTTSSPATATGQQQPTPILVALGGPARQSRLTVLIRFFMVLPHLVVLALLGIAAGVVAVIGWFGALFTGRLPEFAASFLIGYLRWQTRVLGYAILLTDVYPPFSLEDADYPIRVAAAPGQLNRLAVLLRLFLVIPCWILQEILGYGAFTVVQVVSWLIVLVRGEMPAALHQALAAVVRFQARVAGFGLMLTSAYPAGLFGDPEQPWSPTGRAQGYGVYGPAYQAYGAQTYGEEPTSWRLSPSGASRKLVGAFIVLGLMIVAAGGSSAAVLASNNATRTNAENQLQADITPVRNAINNYSTNLKACNGKLSCVGNLDRSVAATLNTFAGQVRTIPMPTTQSRTGAANLAASVAHSASIFARLGSAKNPADYINIAKATQNDLQQSVQQFNEEYLLLGGILTH
jgi:hypothetical protein